jgi:hypothetical protein
VFGGNSRTAVITNVLNESSYYFETWNTLRFAAKAKSIKISPKANFDTEGSEEALKQEISHLLRKIDMLEKNSKGHAQGPAVNNQQVIKLVDRLETAWDGVINGIEERQLLLKEAISKSDEYFINLIMEFRQCLVGRNSEFILKTKFLPILEEMEEFFGQNWTGVGPREVIDKLDCFHEIVKDEIRSLKGVVQSKPQTAKDKLKRIKKRWQHSLERIDEIMSDEEEEKEIINGLLSCMDETSPSAETGKYDQNANKDPLLAEKRFTWGSTDDQANGRVSQPEFHKNPELKDRLMIDLASLNPHNNQEQHLSKDFQEGDMIAGNSKTGRLSSARTKDVKIAEVQELLSQFTPQKIRMVIKENDLLNKKIQKQRFLILEMKKKMDEVEEQRVTKTHRLNRSCDDIPASLLGNLEKVVDESVAPWNDNEFRNFDSIYDERKSFHHRRSTLKGRQSSQTQGFRGQTIDSLLEEDIKINSPRNNEVAESIREILSSDELQEEPKKAQTISKNPEARFPDKRKEEMLNNLFDPAKRFQPKSQKEWRDTGFDRDSYEPYTNVDNLNPMVSTEDFSPYAERASEGVIVESPVKDPFKRSYEPEEINFSSKKREHFESPLSFKKESHMVKSDLESLSKKFKDLEEQKAKWEKKLTLQDAQKENKVNFSKHKIPSENEIIASEKLNGEVVNSSPLIVGSKAPGPPSKISLFTEKQQVSKETKSSKQPTGQMVGSTDESDRHQKHSSNGRIDPLNTKSLKPAPDDPYRSAGAFKKEAYSSPMKLPLRSNYTEETPPRILTDFMPEDSMRRSNNDEELKLMEAVIQEKSKEAIGYLKLIEKLQKENDQLRDNTDANSSLAVYKLKLENKKLKEAIRKIAGKVKQEIDTDPL